MVAGMQLYACSDNDSFTTSRSEYLTFQCDTLTMDTVFSTVPSRTYNFWVYNRSADGLRLNQVRLERGNQTGFRVNVDGSYLDNQSGSQVQGLEVRKGDSIRVFVELTSAFNRADEPQLVSDNLAFTLESGVIQKVNLRAYSWDALLLDSVIIGRDSTIATAKPVVIRGGLKVEEGARLTLKSPTQLYFHSGAGMDVYGALTVEGEPGHDVVLRGDRIDHMFDYLPYDRLSGQWKGVRFYPSSTDNHISFADIHSAEDGIVCDSAFYDEDHVRLNMANTIIHNCKGHGVHTINSYLKMVNCQLTNTLGDCVNVAGGKVEMSYCTLAQFYPFDGNRGVALRYSNSWQGYPVPLHDFLCENTLITGYSDDELMGERDEDSTALFQYHFTDCIIRTPAITDSTLLAGKLDNILFESPKDSLQGKQHFVDIDADQQYYDFHLDSLSTARGKASPSGVTVVDVDREGFPRGDHPDIGCYQYRAKDSGGQQDENSSATSALRRKTKALRSRFRR